MRSILNPKFKYVPSYKTDIRRTFRKARLLARIQKANERKTVQAV
jgi:hypothetical protein